MERQITQRDQIKSWLLKGLSISPLSALNNFGCMRLGARIHELKNEGLDIAGEMTNDGNKTYKRYWLNISKPVKQ